MPWVLYELMALSGVVKQDVAAKFFGVELPSRGYYIVYEENGFWYLHHDGVVRDGVGAKTDCPAFWPTEQEAQAFFDRWKAELVKRAKRANRSLS